MDCKNDVIKRYCLSKILWSHLQQLGSSYQHTEEYKKSPQMSIWTRPKALVNLDSHIEKDKYFYFIWWHTL